MQVFAHIPDNASHSEAATDQATAVSFGSSIETRLLPSSLAATHRGFTFYVAAPASSIVPLNFGGSSSMPKFAE